MKAQDILQKAIDTIGQRGQENGYDTKEERSAADVARLWRGYGTGTRISTCRRKRPGGS